MLKYIKGFIKNVNIFIATINQHYVQSQGLYRQRVNRKDWTCFNGNVFFNLEVDVMEQKYIDALKKLSDCHISDWLEISTKINDIKFNIKAMGITIIILQILILLT